MADTVATVYTKVDYETGELNLLKGERLVIAQALRKTKGIVSEAHAIVCPVGQPYSYSALLRVIKRHSIDPNHFKIR